MYDEFKTEDVTVLLAPAGAGKTTWCIEKIKQLIVEYNAEASEIAFITFTRKGVEEGVKRVLESVDVLVDDLSYFKTFHSMTFNELGYTRGMLFDKRHIRKFNNFFSFKLQTEESSIVSFDSKLLALYDAERSGKAISAMEDGIDAIKYKRFVNAYNSFKQVYGLKDYYDCLIDYSNIGNPLPVKYAFIDEAQDLSKLQWSVAFRALANCDKIFIAGDDYQSIYKYAGAIPENLIAMSNRYTTIKLEKSYRLSKSVYTMAKGITDALSVAVQKEYIPVKNVQGKVEVLSSVDTLVNKIQLNEKNSTKATEWYLLFRCRTHIARMTSQLQRLVLPYHDNNGFCVRTPEISLIDKYYNFRKVGYSTEEKKLEFMTKYGIRDFNNCFTNSALFTEDRTYTVLSYLEKYGMRRLKELSRGTPVVLISTVHKIKGGEARNVAFFLDCTEKVFHNRYVDMDSELRLLYVACTRAMEDLYLVRSESKYGLDDIILTIKDFNGA